VTPPADIDDACRRFDEAVDAARRESTFNYSASVATAVPRTNRSARGMPYATRDARSARKTPPMIFSAMKRTDAGSDARHR
jgi:hypothetical protein